MTEESPTNPFFFNLPPQLCSDPGSTYQYLFIPVDATELPGEEYVRVDIDHPIEGGASMAVHHALVRQCRLLDAAIDKADLDLPDKLEQNPTLYNPRSSTGSPLSTMYPNSVSFSSTDPPSRCPSQLRRGNQNRVITGAMIGGLCGGAGSVLCTIPDCDKATAAAVFRYLQLTAIRVPTIIGRPLTAPLGETVSRWEMDYLLEVTIEKRDPSKHAQLLNIIRIADYLIIDSLRDLCIAFLASIILECASEGDVLRTLGLPRVATAAELAPVFQQFPFLNSSVTLPLTGPTNKDKKNDASGIVANKNSPPKT